MSNLFLLILSITTVKKTLVHAYQSYVTLSSVPQFASDLFTKSIYAFSIFGICITFPIAGPISRAVYGRSPAAIVGSNRTRGMDVCLL